MDSKEEAEYRLQLAEGYLGKATKFFEGRFFDDVVSRAQLASENAIRAIISCFRVPSWTHDPTGELNEVMKRVKITERKKLGNKFLTDLDEAARAARELAPNHGRTTYGDTATHRPPWEVYDERAAKEALLKATCAVNVAKRFISEWFRN